MAVYYVHFLCFGKNSQSQAIMFIVKKNFFKVMYF